MSSAESLDRPVRVLHVVGGLNPGGIETWLIRMLRRVDRLSVAMDFLVHTRDDGFYAAEAIRLGSTIHRLDSRSHRRPLQYHRSLVRLLEAEGPYDIVHSHVHHFSGYVLWAARRARVPVRIAHSHNVGPRIAVKGVPRRLYLTAMKRLIDRYATNRFACSVAAGNALFPCRPFEILPYAVEADMYCPSATTPLRESLHIPEAGIVVCHVGSFTAQKNHKFLVEVAKEVSRRRADVWFVLVGDGPLRGRVEELVAEMGIADRIRFTGVSTHVPEILSEADVFFLPSLYEGLGLVIVEAQTAGLISVVSDQVPAEADVISGAVRRISLDASVNMWADALADAIKSRLTPDVRAEWRRHILATDFDADSSADKLTGIYFQMIEEGYPA